MGEDGWVTLADFQRTGALLPEGAGQTLGVVIYWEPGEDDNRWNLNNGKTLSDGDALRIDLGIRLTATQTPHESDVFGSDYDTTELVFPTFAGGSVSAAVAVDERNQTTQAVELAVGGVKALVPAGVQLRGGTAALTLTVTQMEDTGSNIRPEGHEKLRSLDVHIEGVADTNTTPITVELRGAAPAGLNMGNYRLYHVHAGGTSEMTPVSGRDAFTAPDQFYYDPAAGDLTLYMAVFSEVAVLADLENAWNGTVAEAFAGGSGTEADPWRIANADQLAWLGETVATGENASKGRFYRLVNDINMGAESVAEEQGRLLFYPIGYTAQGYQDAFQGTFDGGGHTIGNISQNTWMMTGTYDGTHYNDAMGLFGYVYGGTVKNLTIDGFRSEGEYAPTGCVAAYAADAVFENIAVRNSHPAAYNTSVAAVVGRDAVSGCSLTFRNITVDSTNTVSALWGSWDVGAAGILGYLGPDSRVLMDRCNVAATLDVYNDVCGNYQYYWYRYCGMLIGTVDRTRADGSLDLAGVTATSCTVNFGSRHEYYYCEFEENTQASYTEDYQFSRVPHSQLNLDADPVTCTHDHTAAEDKRAVYLPFYQLFGGHGWGVDGVDLREYNDLQITVDRKIETGPEVSADKFAPVTGITALESGRAYRLGDLFEAVEGATINSAAVTVSLTDTTPDNEQTVTMAYTADPADWRNSRVTFTGGDVIDITIQDYDFCNPTCLSGIQIIEPPVRIVTRQVRLLPEVVSDLPEGALAAAPGVQFNNSPYAYTNKNLFAGKRITRIGIPVKSVAALDENQTFTLSVVKTTSDPYVYVSRHELKLPLDQLGSFTTVNKWVYVDVDLTLAADETLAFGMPGDTVTWGYATTNDSAYHFRSASGSWSSTIKESILFDVYATETLEFEKTAEGYAAVTESAVFPHVLTDFPESAIAGGNPVEFTNPPYSYVNQTLFAGKHITRIGIPVQSVLTLDSTPFFTLSVVKQGSGNYQYVSQHRLELPLEELNGSKSVNRWIWWELDLTLAADETLAFGGKEDTISWAWKNGFADTTYQFRTAAGNQTRGIFFDIRTETVLTYADYLQQLKQEQERLEAEQEQARLDAALQEALAGKGISILGDSISTFTGWSNNTAYNSTIGGNYVWYDGAKGVTSVSETWWMQAVTRCGLDLVVNNSWSGDEVTRLGVSRAQQLHNNDGREPDIIAVYLGINDFRRGKTVEVFREAYEKMLGGMQERYPDADVYLFTLLYTTNMESSYYQYEDVVLYNAVIREIAEQYGCTLVDLYSDTGITPENLSSYMHDGKLHPNYEGMDRITQCLVDALRDAYLK